MKLRQLTESEVTFTVSIEEEDIPVRGHYMSGDPKYEAEDRALEDAIIERLDRGDIEAWCYIKVTATWNGFEGTAGIGGNSLSRDYTADTVVDEYGLKLEALDDLNAEIRRMVGKVSELVTCE